MSANKRIQVRAENPSGVCGKIEHMTVEELKERSVGNEFDGSCPACGHFHLTRAEIDTLEQKKITDSDHYKAMKQKAEAEQ